MLTKTSTPDKYMYKEIIMNTCTECKQEKPVEEFPWRNKRLGKRNKVCKECGRQRSKHHYNENKQYYFDKAKRHDKLFQEWYKEFMLDKKCENCGEDHWATLDWHHLNGEEKENTISRLRSNTSKRRLLEEVEKCICLCSNCHRILHYG